jgi:hypothetical protein
MGKMVKGKRVKLDVCGKQIYAIMRDDWVLYSIKEGKGKPSNRSSYEKIKTKTLKRLAALNMILLKANLDPQKISSQLLADIVQAWMDGNRQTAFDYANALISIHSFRDIPHAPKIEPIGS